MDDYLSDGDGDGESEEEMNVIEVREESIARVELNESSDEDDGGWEMARQQRVVEEEQHFDRTLAASHSYMGGGLVPLRGRSLLEPGWCGRLLVASHSGAVFPGETVPMLLPDVDDATLLSTVIRKDKLFGLLCPDGTGTMVSGFGVVCEVYEAGSAGAGAARGNTALSCKARARHRFRLLDMPKEPTPLHAYSRMRFAEVRVLPELEPADPLRLARLASLDGLRRPRPATGPGSASDEDPASEAGTGSTPSADQASAPAPDQVPAPCDSPVRRRVRCLDAALTPWPCFMYELLDYRRVRHQLHTHFSSLDFGRLPEEPVALSFWVASNLTLSARDRLALFSVDDSLLRLHMELRFIARRGLLCCMACGAEIARREDALPMSSEGVHSNYTNSGGYMHDIVTVSNACGVRPSGQSSAEFSWFPGYSWLILMCATCNGHIGWRFNAMSRSLRPQQFFGLCRNFVQPRGDADDDEL